MKIRVVSPWYPDYSTPRSGTFVASQVEALKAAGHQIQVQVPQIFPAPAGQVPQMVADSMRTLVGRSVDAMFHTVDEVTYIPSPVPSRSGPLGRTDAMAKSISMLASMEEERPDLIHAHVGLPAGLAVAKSEKDLPLVVTEHWSGLATALENREVAEAYGDLIRNAKGFICVSNHLKGQICTAVGEWASDLIQVVPNVVDLSGIDFRQRDRFGFSSWIYVGGLTRNKGVQTLVRAFDVYVKRHDRSAVLTIVGDGPLRRWIERFSASRGLADAIDVVGPIEHASLSTHLYGADVMVHLSPVETFGIASLEGIASGLPVVSLRSTGADETWGSLEKECGALLDVDSTPSQIAAAVAALRDSAESLDIAMGRSMIERRYSPNVVARQLVGIYEAAVT